MRHIHVVVHARAKLYIKTKIELRARIDGLYTEVSKRSCANFDYKCATLLSQALLIVCRTLMLLMSEAATSSERLDTSIHNEL